MRGREDFFWLTSGECTLTLGEKRVFTSSECGLEPSADERSQAPMCVGGRGRLSRISSNASQKAIRETGCVRNCAGDGVACETVEACDLIFDIFRMSGGGAGVDVDAAD